MTIAMEVLTEDEQENYNGVRDRLKPDERFDQVDLDAYLIVSMHEFDLKVTQAIELTEQWIVKFTQNKASIPKQVNMRQQTMEEMLKRSDENRMSVFS